MISVPAEPFARLVDEYLARQTAANPEGCDAIVVESLAEKLGMTGKSLGVVRAKWRKPDARMTFDNADRILCALRLVHLWHTEEEYSTIYSQVELERSCEWCGENFEMTSVNRRHCSRRCTRLAYRQTLGAVAA